MLGRPQSAIARLRDRLHRAACQQALQVLLDGAMFHRIDESQVGMGWIQEPMRDHFRERMRFVQEFEDVLLDRKSVV